MSNADEPFDPLPALKAEIDQAIETASDMGRMARANYEAFVAEGFTNQQALYLVATQMVRDPGDTPDGI